MSDSMYRVVLGRRPSKNEKNHTALDGLFRDFISADSKKNPSEFRKQYPRLEAFLAHWQESPFEKNETLRRDAENLIPT